MKCARSMEKKIISQKTNPKRISLMNKFLAPLLANFCVDVDTRHCVLELLNKEKVGLGSISHVRISVSAKGQD